MGGSPYNMARAAALRGASVGYINPLSTDHFGKQLANQLAQDGVHVLSDSSRLPTSLAVVQINGGQPSYGFYREGIADRDYTVDSVLSMLKAHPPGVLHTGSLLLVPPEHTKAIAILEGAKNLGWTISVDVNLRPKLAPDLPAYVQAVKEVAKLADWIKASDEDLMLLGVEAPTRGNGKDIAALFRNNGASRIALTFGSDGAWLEVDGECAEADVPPTQVVDTVGAGDTFWGNCLGDWVSDAESRSRVTQTLKEAMLAAAINCARAGCQPPSYEETMAAQRSRAASLQ
jgi:fructokinase